MHRFFFRVAFASKEVQGEGKSSFCIRNTWLRIAVSEVMFATALMVPFIKPNRLGDRLVCQSTAYLRWLFQLYWPCTQSATTQVPSKVINTWSHHNCNCCKNILKNTNRHTHLLPLVLSLEDLQASQICHFASQLPREMGCCGYHFRQLLDYAASVAGPLQMIMALRKSRTSWNPWFNL